MRLADLLAERGDLDGLRARADAGDWDAAGRLARLQAELLAGRGDLDGLRARPTPATRMPPLSWPTCWPSAATWTGCAPGPMPTIRTPPGSWPARPAGSNHSAIGVSEPPGRERRQPPFENSWTGLHESCNGLVAVGWSLGLV